MEKLDKIILFLILITVGSKTFGQPNSDRFFGRWKSIESSTTNKEMEIIFSSNDSTYSEILKDKSGREISRSKTIFKFLNDSTVYLGNRKKDKYFVIKFIDDIDVDIIKLDPLTSTLSESIPMRYLYIFKRCKN